MSGKISVIRRDGHLCNNASDMWCSQSPVRSYGHVITTLPFSCDILLFIDFSDYEHII